MSNVMVTVVCMTYNHEKFIKETLESFLGQKTNFRYEILVHDDASTDRTAQIVREYEKEHPGKIIGIFQKENQYSKRPKSLFRYQIYPHCKGKYIALCEGDDFWLDEHKLQMQVDFLEAHQDYALTVHDAVCMDCSDFTIRAKKPYETDREITAEEIIMRYNGNLPTASMVFPASVIEDAEFFWKCGIGDWPLQLQCILKGKVYYFSRIMSVYRVSLKGSWSVEWEKNSEKYFVHCVKMIDFLQKYNRFTKRIYQKYVVTQIQFYASKILDIFRELYRDNYLEKCRIFDTENQFQYHTIIQKLKHIYLQTYDEKFCDSRIEKFARKYNHILLFGAGKYASNLAVQLKNNQIDFEGFVVSETKSKKQFFQDKPVWCLKTLPFKINDIGIIVAIKPVIWNQLVDSLEKHNVKDFICPFLLESDS